MPVRILQMIRFWSIFLLSLLLSLLCACQPQPLSGSVPTDAPPLSSTAISLVHTTVLPVPTRTPTVAELLWPYTILGLRQHRFEHGPIKIESKMNKTDIYTRYLISYLSDGIKITGIMQIPVEGRPPFPVIVMNHGFFSRTDFKSGDGTDRAAEYLNKHGYLTIASDYRSWGGSDIGPSLYYSGLAIDVVNLIKSVSLVKEADAHRIGIWGHSMGGGVTMKVLTLDTGVRAAVLYSTVSADNGDILARWGLGCIGDIAAGENQLDCNSSDVVPLDLPPELIRAYYEASKDPATLQSTSPLFHLEFISAPIQINYGTNDGKTTAGTPPEWSQRLYAALHAAGKSAELFAYDGEFHSFNGDNWVAFMERSAHFYDQFVKSP